jgi:hypothetical protein
MPMLAPMSMVLPSTGVWSEGDGVQDLRGDGLRLRAVGPRQENGELVAAQTTEEIAVPQSAGAAASRP